MARNATKDLTQGSPMKLILGFSIPLLFGFLFQQFYNLMDLFIVGQNLGVDPLAAVGATGSLSFLIIGFCMGVTGGFAIPLAQKFGAKDVKSFKCFMVNSFYLSIAFSVVMTVLTVVYCRPILELMQTPENIIDQSYSYIVIIFIGIPVTYLYNLVAGIVRSIGDSKTPVVFLIIASVMNIGLDLFFIRVMHTGVYGAALATVISQLFSGIGCMIYSYHRFEILHTSKEERKLNWQCIKVLCVMGIPMGLQYSITAIGSVILQRNVNTLGSDAVAAMTTGSKIGLFFCCPFDALGSTMATYGGQNMGAGEIARIKRGLNACSMLGIAYSIVAFIVLFFTGRYLAAFFAEKATVQILDNAHFFLISNSIFYIPLAFVNIVRFLIQGMGHSRIAVLAGVCEMVARAFVGSVFVPIFGFKAACFASPVAWLLADLFLFPAYFLVIRKAEKMLAIKSSII